MIASHTEIIPASDAVRWEEVLAESEAYDFYHLPGYHAMTQEGAAESGGRLFVYREGERLAAWPFLLRSLGDVDGLEGLADHLNDATSVYGYPGPIFSGQGRSDDEFQIRFGLALHSCARDMGIVSLFSRMHPLLENAVCGIGVGVVIPMGDTVSVDLSQSEDAQWSDLRANHRRDIRKAMENGVRVIHDVSLHYLDQFIDLYRATMIHVNAGPQYFFDREYFVRLQKILGRRFNLFVALANNTVCSAALFVHTGPFIQYHLSATNLDFRTLAPTKVVVNEVRLWGKAVGARYLHLGGGVGSRRDSLFLFKAGFSHLRHRFFVFRHVVKPEIYEALVEARRSWLLQNDLAMTATEYFPLYRSNGHPVAVTV